MALTSPPPLRNDAFKPANMRLVIDDDKEEADEEDGGGEIEG